MTEELKVLSEAWNRAWLEKDVATVERMMGSEYIYIAPNGQVLGRDAILEIIRAPSYRLSWGTRAEVSVKPLGAEAALVMHRWQGEGSFQGNSFKDDHRCTTVCIREKHQWRIVHEHCSAVAE
jgi:uncharacterized protein (TIGR02246 family)